MTERDCGCSARHFCELHEAAPELRDALTDALRIVNAFDKEHDSVLTAWTSHVVLCPLHAAAPEMRDILRVLADVADSARHHDFTLLANDARALLARIKPLTKGKET